MTDMLLGLADWAIPLVLIVVPLYALMRGVEVYSVFCRGATEGMQLLLQILPGLLGMLVAVEGFRAGGAMDIAAAWLAPLLDRLGIPADVLPLALIRSFSGSGALGYTAGLIEEFGADSYIGRLAAVMQGSTDTTFYVLAVYFGSVGVMRYRYAVAAGLLADLTAFLCSFWLVSLVWG